MAHEMSALVEVLINTLRRLKQEQGIMITAQGTLGGGTPKDLEKYLDEALPLVLKYRVLGISMAEFEDVMPGTYGLIMEKLRELDTCASKTSE